MQSSPDAQLLRDYAGAKSEPAFAEIVRRHGDLVYSAALRQTAAPEVATEITQTVFIALARKAPALARAMQNDASLAGWLHRATRYVVLNYLREERRRHARERQIMAHLDSPPESSTSWMAVAPVLDELIANLGEQDRAALLLRFFKNQDFHSVGLALGISDDAAQKRVARSLEKLRLALMRRGVTTTAAALAETITVHAVQAAPAGLSGAWVSASLAAATTETSAVFTLLKLMSMTKLQLGAGAIIVAGLTTTVVIQHRTARDLSADNQALRNRVADLSAVAERLSNSLAQPAAPAEMSGDQFRELLRLRGEVGRLRDQTNRLARAHDMRLSSPANPPQAANTQSDLPADFVAHRMNVINAAKLIGLAMHMYANDNNNQFPTNFDGSAIYLNNKTNIAGDIGFDTFEMVNIGRVSPQFPEAIALREISPRQLPNGTWERVYLRADGSVQLAGSPNGNFDNWELNNSQAIPAPAQ